MKRAAAYARYSSDRQSDTSIEAQLSKIREYCQNKGYEIVREYIDRAQSATTDKREEFQRMIKDAEDNLFDVVVVYKLDRFARNLYDSVVYTKKLEELGIALESTTEPITQDIAGKFFRNIMSAINELYIENLKQEIRDKAIVVAKKGFFMGGYPPFGFSLEETFDEYGKLRKKYVINEKEAPIVREIFERAAKGYSLQKIADFLNEKGYKTRRGNIWTTRSIYEMLLNEKYIGTFVYNKENKKNRRVEREDVIKIPGALPAIVDEETYWKARNRLRIGTRRNKRHEYYLLKLVYCGVCGSPMTVGSGGNCPTYQCSEAKVKHLKNHIKISKNKLESYVYNHVKHNFFKNVDFEQLAKEINQKLAEHNQGKTKQLEKLQAEKVELEAKIRRAVEALLNGIELDVLREELQKLKARKAEIEYQIIQLYHKETPEFVTAEGLEKMWGELEKLFESDKGTVFKTLIDKVIVHDDGYIEIKYKGIETLF